MLGWPVQLRDDPCAEAYRALRQAGADPFRAMTLTAIAWAESRCNPAAVRKCPPDCVPGQAPEYSVGAFQINLQAHPDVSEECAVDLLCAARYALRLPLTAWTAFRTGAYLRAPFIGGGGPLVSLTQKVSPQFTRQFIVAVSVVLIVVAGAELLRRRKR